MFSSLDLRIAMPHETNLFSAVNRDFRVLMKATEKNPNVLQACSRISECTLMIKEQGVWSANLRIRVIVDLKVEALSAVLSVGGN